MPPGPEAIVEGYEQEGPTEGQQLASSKTKPSAHGPGCRRRDGRGCRRSAPRSTGSRANDGAGQVASAKDPATAAAAGAAGAAEANGAAGAAGVAEAAAANPSLNAAAELPAFSWPSSMPWAPDSALRAKMSASLVEGVGLGRRTSGTMGPSKADVEEEVATSGGEAKEGKAGISGSGTESRRDEGAGGESKSRNCRALLGASAGLEAARARSTAESGGDLATRRGVEGPDGVDATAAIPGVATEDVEA